MFSDISRGSWRVRLQGVSLGFGRAAGRGPRGAAAVIAVMFLSIIAITLAAAATVYGEYKLGWDRYRAAGQIWGEWVLALPRAPNAIPAAWTGGSWVAVRDDLYGGSDASLPTSGLGADVGRDFGISLSDTAMHFTYVDVPSVAGETCWVFLGTPSCVTPCVCERVGASMLRPRSRGRLDAVRRGTIDGGLSTVAITDGNGNLRGPEAIIAFEQEMESRLPASWGGGFVAGDVVAVAHISIPYNERALYRTAPPGRPDLARMRTDLDAGTGRVTVEGPRVEAVEANGIGNVTVTFEPSGASTEDNPEAAVRADFVVLGSLSLTASGLMRPHEVGKRDGVLVPASDEGVGIRIEGTARFQSAEAGCYHNKAPERCVSALEVNVARIGINRNATVKQEPVGSGGSGVGTTTLNAGTIAISGRCHGCNNF